MNDSTADMANMASAMAAPKAQTIDDSPAFYPQTFIKEVAIELRGDFAFDNLPHNLDSSKRKKKSSLLKDGNRPFVGRDEEINKFKKMLESGKGVYLVTGYRGMGKTSFVNRVLNSYNEEVSGLPKGNGWKQIIQKIRLRLKPQLPYTPLTITIAQKQPTEAELLRLIVSTLYDKCRENAGIDKSEKVKRITAEILKASLLVFFPLFFVFVYKPDVLTTLFVFKDGIWEYKSLEIILKAVVIGTVWLIVGCFLMLTFYKLKGVPSFFKKIQALHKRCHANVSNENESLSEISVDSLTTKLSHKGKKVTENYPIASSKEIEHELMEFLRMRSLQKKMRFVFIFDELDKVEHSFVSPGESMTGTNYLETHLEKAYLDKLRERKDAIQNIIAGLKNFFTTSEAPFIFIAGREMFDASMADISDRQSSISSIFSYVFYIESLLREYIKDTSSLSAGIEQFLFKTIYGNDAKEPLNLYKPDATNINRKDYPEHVVKVNTLLQNFVVYLTYRSNGSPKKLIKLIQEFVKVDLDVKDVHKKMIHWVNPKGGLTNKVYLHFNYKQQQRIGFISYLYRPFLVKYGHSFKKYSDNLIVSTSFLFDHLLKFHPFAFSHTHLELIPEVLSTNSTPALRDHIKKIIDFLLMNHIKETEIGLFDYKFYSKTVNEIFYLSKTFEEESAGFNFTLDESYLIKMHVRHKLAELRNVYSASPQNTEQSTSLILSIAYLNGLLGDLHFFDQEYDDAIIAYSDVLKPVNNLNVSEMNMRDFIVLQKYKLKLGLAFEKIKSFEESLSLYSDAVLDAKRFIIERIRAKKITCYAVNDTNPDGKPDSYISSSLSDLLQTCNQAFLAKMVLQEKMGVEGITAIKTGITMGGFLYLTDMVKYHCGKNATIVSNFFLQLGNLLYLKNSIKGFEWNQYKVYHRGIPVSYLNEINAIIVTNAKYIPVNNRYRMPMMALNMYCIGLKHLLEDRIAGFTLDTQTNVLNNILDALTSKKFKDMHTSLSKIHFKYIAIFLSNLGDCILSMLQNTAAFFDIEEVINEAKLRILFEEIKSDKNSSDGDLSESIFPALFSLDKNKDQEISPYKVICFYYVAGYFFRKCSRPRSFSFQLRKILYVVRLTFSERKENSEIANHFIYILDKIVVSAILKTASLTSEYSDVHDAKKFIENLQGTPVPQLSKQIRNNIFNFPDTREPVLLLAHIRLKLLNPPYEELKDNCFSNNSIATQYLRLLELTYAAKFFEKKLNEIKKRNNCLKLDEEEIKQCCISYLHSLMSVIQIMEVYDNDYLVGNSFLAYHHFRLAKFFTFNEDGVNEFDLSKKTCEAAQLAIQLEISSDKSSFSQYDSHYNYEMAALHYDKAIKLHTAGDDYKKAINEIHYLEDDLSDGAYHFGAAMDRYLLVNGKLENLYKICKQQTNQQWNTYNEFAY